ncbi:hypothetical protein ACA910_014359 [Epithemia clementina (nom. ined.)]
MKAVVLPLAVSSVLGFAPTPFAGLGRVAGPTTTLLNANLVKEFEVGKKKIQVYDGDYSDQVVALTVKTAKAAIEAKGSFSLAIPGGSVVKSLGGMSADSFDMSKMQVYFCNERIGANKCYTGALEAFVEKCGVPLENVHKVPEDGTPEEVAAQYEAMIRAAPSLDQSGDIPSVDLILLGTGDDGHCGSLYPGSDEIKATGQGKVVLPIDEGDKKSIAVSMDFMCAAKTALVSAAEPKRSLMVKRALTCEYEEWGCPAALVDAVNTIWFVDTDSVAEYESTVVV